MTTTTIRCCVGSARFGIKAHEAQIEDFPKQPSQPDGLGRMCREHWQAYTARLRRDALARKAADVLATGEASAEGASTPSEATSKPKRTTRKRGPQSAEPTPNVAEAERAEALISAVDAMPAGEMVQRVGDVDVQAALEVSAASRMLAD